MINISISRRQLMFTYYQDAYCYYFRKPAGIPSTFGKQPSFLDMLLQQQEKSCIVQSLFAFFGTERELGLLNRLDSETSGLLYFAKTPRIFQQFKALQTSLQLSKYYLAEVYGNIGHHYKITFPLAHHRYNIDRMIVIKTENDLKKAKGNLHHLTTEIVESQFLPTSKTSILLIRIQKGLRHQIRIHLASLGYPICGDELYSKSNHKNYDKLQLFSVGLETI